MLRAAAHGTLRSHHGSNTIEPVVFLASKAQYATFPTETVRTGPAFITKGDAAAVRDLSKAGFR